LIARTESTSSSPNRREFLQIGRIVRDATYFVRAFMAAATTGICSAASGVGQNASIMWYVLRPNSSAPPPLALPPTQSAKLRVLPACMRPAHVAMRVDEVAVDGNRLEHEQLLHESNLAR
jgi:hypothetical protein